jgi:3-deoxy-D-manno-octulosonic-acid transferase
MMLLYNLLWPLGLLFFLPAFLLKMFRRGSYRKDFGQRLGIYSCDVQRRLRGMHPLWMHAVSVGEVLIAQKLAKQLHSLQLDSQFVLTTTTTTGYALAQKSATPWMTVLYTPLDFLPVMRRAFRVIAPQCIVLIEAEVWPNLVNEAVSRKIPVALANARLSPRSERKFLRFRFLFAPIFRKLSLLCVPDAVDAGRWRRLGATQERIQVVGNIKFDPEENRGSSTEPRRFLEQIGIDASRPILLGGSTHRSEEAILMEAFVVLQREFTNLFLVIVPRHVERAGEIEALARERALRMTRRTQPKETPPDVLLLDTTGELADWYGIATVVFIGKSLTAHGGQNPVEAIAAGKPVIFGPHMENFDALAKSLVNEEAAFRAHDGNELTSLLGALLREPALRGTMTARATLVIESHREATRRTAGLIAALN